jgi:hypothetical protein
MSREFSYQAFCHRRLAAVSKYCEVHAGPSRQRISTNTRAKSGASSANTEQNCKLQTKSAGCLRVSGAQGEHLSTQRKSPGCTLPSAEENANSSVQVGSSHAASAISPETLGSGAAECSNGQQRDAPAMSVPRKALLTASKQSGADEMSVKCERMAPEDTHDAKEAQRRREANIKAMLSDTVEVERQSVLPRFLQVGSYYTTLHVESFQQTLGMLQTCLGAFLTMLAHSSTFQRVKWNSAMQWPARSCISCRSVKPKSS